MLCSTTLFLYFFFINLTRTEILQNLCFVPPLNLPPYRHMLGIAFFYILRRIHEDLQHMILSPVSRAGGVAEFTLISLGWVQIEQISENSVFYR